VLYYAQSGDWLPAVAIRFGVDVNEIVSPKVLPEKGLLDAGFASVYTGATIDSRQ
jgi:hypothetical protein